MALELQMRTIQTFWTYTKFSFEKHGPWISGLIRHMKDIRVRRFSVVTVSWQKLKQSSSHRAALGS
jgi:hypothetical protein